MINYVNGQIEQVKWPKAAPVYGLKLSPDFDEHKHPCVYAQSNKSVVMINIQTKQVSEIAKVEYSGNGYIKVLEIIPD